MQYSVYHFVWHPVVLIQSSFLFLLGIKGDKGWQREKEEEEGGRGRRKRRRRRKKKINRQDER